MALGIVAALLIAAPPTGDERQVRTIRVKVLYELGADRSDHAARELVQVAKTAKEVWERQAALQALADHHKHIAEPAVKALLDDRELAIRAEATIKHYQWTQNPKTLERLAKLRQYGTGLRRAFQTGHDRGKPTYGKGAEAFFRESTRHSLIYTRLDGALGLLEMGPKTVSQEGLVILENALASTSADDRLVAVKHMSMTWDSPEVKVLLETATRDSDRRVAQAAKNIIASSK